MLGVIFFSSVRPRKTGNGQSSRRHQSIIGCETASVTRRYFSRPSSLHHDHVLTICFRDSYIYVVVIAILSVYNVCVKLHIFLKFKQRLFLGFLFWRELTRRERRPWKKPRFVSALPFLTSAPKKQAKSCQQPLEQHNYLNISSLTFPSC